MTGQDIVKAVMEGKSVLMSNGWTMKKVRLSNENRIEIDLGGKYLTNQAASQITESGGIYERVGWAARYFVPTDAKRGGETMSGIMQKTGSNAVAVKGDEEDAAQASDNQGPAFSRGEGGAKGIGRSKVFSVVKAIRAKWANAPEVVIVDDMNDAAVSDTVRAENERQLSKGAKGQPEGFVYGGRVYVVASQMNTPGDVVRVLLHESLGHFGLRGVFGGELNKILKQIAALRRKDVEAKARQYGLDMEVERDRLIAAEEVLAELAQTNPKSGFVQRTIAAIRKWLRENIEHYKDLKLTDGEIISNYIVPAREFVQRGRTAAQGGLAGAFSRKEVADFAKAVDDVLDRKSNAAIRIGNTPHALRQGTVPKRSLWVTKRVIDKLYREHGLSRQQIKSLPELLANPIMVLDSTTEPGNFVVLTSETHKGKPIIATINPNGEIKRIGLANVVTSAYEKPGTVIADWMLNGKLIASDHEKALAWITMQGLKLSRRTPEVTVAPESDRTGRDGSILHQLQEAVRKSLPINLPKKVDDVNLSRSSPTDTPAFIETPASYEEVTGAGPVSRSRRHQPAGVNGRLEEMRAIVKGEVKPDGSNPDIRFSRSAASAGAAPATVATVATPATPFRDRMEKIADSLIYNFQDRFKPLKDIQKRAGLVPEDEDAALAEERYSGTVRARTDEFEQDMRTPLVKAIHDSGVAYEDVEDYLHALHAPSRNAAMRAINPTEEELKAQTQALEAQRDGLANDADVKDYVKARRELRQAEADIEDGIADESLGRMIKQEIAQLKKMASVTNYIDAVDKLRALRNVKPFEGDNTALSGMSNAESKAILAKIDGNGSKRAMERISALVDSITSKTRQIFIDSGLERPETIEAWNKQYEHYVPLHRDEVGGGTGMPRVGQGFNIREKESKRATGSNREVTHILAHVVAQHETAIIRSEKSKVDRVTDRFTATAEPRGYIWGYPAEMKSVDHVSTAVYTCYSVAVPQKTFPKTEACRSLIFPPFRACLINMHFRLLLACSRRAAVKIPTVFPYFLLLLGGFVLHALPLAPAFAQSPVNVEFIDKGQIVKTVSLDDPRAIAPAVSIKVFEAHEKAERVYRAFTARPLFRKVFGKDWEKAQEIMFTSIDGYQPSIPVVKFLAHDAYLAFAHEDGTPFRLNNRLQNNEIVQLGPLYLVWDNIGSQALLQAGALDMPYQIKSVEFKSVNSFPHMVPPPKASPGAQRGFMHFRQLCAACHTINGDGGGKTPELNYPISVVEYIKAPFLKRWIENPQSIRYNATMPALAEEIPNREKVTEELIAYLQAMSGAKRAPALTK